MRVGVLGPLLVRTGGRDVTPGSQRLRDVFVALLQRRGRPVPAPTLLHLAWADEADHLTVSAVHTTVARLRRLLGRQAIGSRDLGYLIDRDVSTDADEFADLVARARRQVTDGAHAPAADAYRGALALWRGPEPFPDIRAELVDTDRARLIELRALATEELAAVLLDHPDTGTSVEALSLTAELIAAQPLRERPHHLAMLAAYRCHRQAAALQIYLDLRQRLRTELGIEPTPATTRLHSLILRQDPSLEKRTQPAPRQPTPVALPVARGVPAPVSPLIGREAELSAVQQALSSGRRLVTLVGPGGVGKSRLLIEVGTRYGSGSGVSPSRLLYTEMSGLDAGGPEELAAAIALHHGVLEPHRPAVQSLIAAFGDGNWLLLVDEAEWVAESMASVATAILQSCPGTALVVTSRIPLDVAGESLVAVEPLTCPGAGADQATVRSTAAVQFLVQRLSDRAVAVGTDGDSTALLAAIARRVDGLPLALELAAGQASGRSLAELAALVDAPLDIAAWGHPRNARHRSLRDTLQWSVDRLDPRQRTVLARLGVFVGRFDLAAARAVAGSVGDGEESAIDGVVRSLTREGLVHVERTGASRLQFRLLRTVRDLALESLDADDPGRAELAATRALHRRWHAGRWRAGGDDLVEDVREHVDDYLEALHSSLMSRDATTLADLTLTLAQFWQFVGGQGVGLQWIGRVLDSDVLGPGERAQVLAQRAALALHHDPALVLADTAAAIPLLESSASSAHTVTAVVVRALELLAQDRLTEATTHADHAVDIARGRSAEELANALGNQAVIYAVIDNPVRASAAIDEAVDRLASTAPTLEGVVAASAIALAMVNLERFHDAVALLDGTDVPPAASPPPARFQLTLGWACLGSGDFTRAMACFVANIPAPAGPRAADRHAAETVLGAACTLAALGDGAAGAALAGATELLPRVGYRCPPALERAITRARLQVAHQVWPNFSSQPTSALLEHLERLLTNAGGAQVGGAGQFGGAADTAAG
jgi:predicted ATPase/DNA-binding SARP family transcriptional activator